MKSCLVVDDSRVIRTVACRILESMNFETLEAESGAGALQACRTHMPDVILLDWTMRDMGGAEFLRSLRREQGGKQPVVVLCTIENDAEKINEAINAGASEYLVKPFDRDAIAAKFAAVGLV
ncbi:MAG TPA: response regulator [Rhizomicrobium sp.]|nr:response regulator [Rhizomicrobium sp.]